jgi:hypothetical protein
MKRKIESQQDDNRLRNYRDYRAKFISEYLEISQEQSSDQVELKFSQRFSELLERIKQNDLENEFEDIKTFEKKFLAEKKNENLKRLIEDFGSFYLSLLEERIHNLLVLIYKEGNIQLESKNEAVSNLEKIFLSLSKEDLAEFETYQIPFFPEKHSRKIPREGVLAHTLLILVHNYDSDLSEKQRKLENKIYNLLSKLPSENFDFTLLSNNVGKKTLPNQRFSSILSNSKGLVSKNLIKRIGCYIDFHKDFLYVLDKEKGLND